MGTHHLSSTALSLALVAGAVVCIGIFKIYSRWVDGKAAQEKAAKDVRE